MRRHGNRKNTEIMWEILRCLKIMWFIRLDLMVKNIPNEWNLSRGLELKFSGSGIVFSLLLKRIQRYSHSVELVTPMNEPELLSGGASPTCRVVVSSAAPSFYVSLLTHLLLGSRAEQERPELCNMQSCGNEHEEDSKRKSKIRSFSCLLGTNHFL